MPYLDANGTRLYYEVTGDGPPLLLISGLGGNRNSWLPVLPWLSQRYQCITFDNRGAGRSDVPAGPYSIEDMAADTLALIEHLGLAPIRAVGWSMGGVILQSLLIDQPQVISRAVLLSTLPCYSPLQASWLTGQMALRQAGVDPLTLATSGIPWTYTANTVTNHESAYAALELAAADPERMSDEAFLAQAQGLQKFDRRRELGTIKTPTLVLVGAEDVLTPPSQAIDIAQRIPASSLVVLARGGHAMIIEYAPSVLSAIDEFIAGSG